MKHLLEASLSIIVELLTKKLQDTEGDAPHPSPEPLLAFPSGLTETPHLAIISMGLTWAHDDSFGQLLHKQKMVDSENRSLKHATAWPAHHIITKWL